MHQLIPRPYKLYNKMQNYAWGTKNENAFIPKFLGIEAQKDLPYAELWIGAHPKAPSEIEIDGQKIPLNIVIEKYTNECLGDYVTEKFNGKFPFLLKILSAANALSIQLHPNKVQAEKLHEKDPENYPNDNHKPEIAIAVDSLIAIAGFKPVGKIINIIKELRELSDLIGDEYIDRLLRARLQNEKEYYIKAIYTSIMKESGNKPKLDSVILEICNRIKLKESHSEEETQFLLQHELYGNDIGLLSFFFFNMINLEPNQAIFTDDGVPHAYIKGNIIECMANSDNVVRAGLTDKYKDVITLVNIIKYDFDEYEIINQKALNDEIVFSTPAEEFQVSLFRKRIGFKKEYTTKSKPTVFLVENGELEINWISNGEKMFQRFRKGESFFIPAALKNYNLKIIEASKYFVVDIP